MAGIGSLALPAGDNQFSGDGIVSQLIVPVGRKLGEHASIGSQLMAEWPTGNGNRQFLWGGTVVFATTLSVRSAAFFELALEVPGGSGPHGFLHSGFTYLIGPRLQIDFHGGTELTGSAPDFFLGTGISVLR